MSLVFRKFRNIAHDDAKNVRPPYPRLRLSPHLHLARPRVRPQTGTIVRCTRRVRPQLSFHCLLLRSSEVERNKSVMPPRASAGAAVRKKAERRQQQANAKEAREAELSLQLEGWWAKHDADASGTLDSAEFKGLLVAVLGGDIEDEFVVRLVDATGGEITKLNVHKAIGKYQAYLKDKATLDALFSKYDSDGNGTVDKSEMQAILSACAQAIPGCPKDEV